MAATDKMYRPEIHGPKLPMPGGGGFTTQPVKPGKPGGGEFRPLPIKPGKPSRPGDSIMKPQPVLTPKPIVKEPGKVYAGGNPNFDMRTGTTRTPVTSPVNRADNPARVAQTTSSVNAIGGY